jgi:hypothetical protein
VYLYFKITFFNATLNTHICNFNANISFEFAERTITPVKQGKMTESMESVLLDKVIDFGIDQFQRTTPGPLKPLSQLMFLGNRQSGPNSHNAPKTLRGMGPSDFVEVGQNFVFGGGQPLEIDLNLLDFRDIQRSLEKNNQFMNHLRQEKLLAKNTGKSKMSKIAIQQLPYSFISKFEERNIIGNAFVSINGVMTINPKGDYVLQGLVLPSMSAPFDKFDFDKKELGKRSFKGEISTRLGNKMSGTNFKMHFFGQKKFSINGNI